MHIQISRQARVTLAAAMCIASLTSCGGGGAASSPAAPPPPVREQGLRQFAGGVGEIIDTTALTRDIFLFPSAIAVDGGGNMYVTDAGKVLRVTSGGAVTAVGTPPGCILNGAAVDKAGNFLTSCGNAIYKMSPSGVFTLIAGVSNSWGFADGKAEAARFNSPAGVAIGGDGAMLVIDYANFRIRKIGADGVVTTLAGNGVLGAVDGTGVAAGFSYLSGIALDSQGNAYVMDGGALRKITPAGAVSTVAGVAEASGAVDGQGADARLAGGALVVAASGKVYLASGSTIRVITPGGQVSTLATYTAPPGSDGPSTAFAFKFLKGLTVDASDNLVALDANDYNNQIRKVTPAGLVTRLAGTQDPLIVLTGPPKLAGFVDGEAALARFYDPRGIAVDALGNVLVADFGNNAVRRVTPAGAVTTLARSVSKAAGVTVDTAGNVYVMGAGSLQKVSPDGTYSAVPLPTIELNPGFNGGYQDAIAADGAGNIYLSFLQSREIPCPRPNACLRENKTSFQKMTPTGQWSAIASGDFSPSGIAVDRTGTLYFSYANTIMKIAASGAVTTFAGTSGMSGTADGIGPAARFLGANHMAADAAGNVYVVDSGNSTIRKITPAGSVTTIAGTVGSYKLTLGALPGSLPIVSGLAVDADGNLVASVPNGLIKITLP